jgi:hypothetical protein
VPVRVLTVHSVAGVLMILLLLLLLVAANRKDPAEAWS